MAAGLHADLLAVYVETPRTADLPAIDRDRLTQNMKLAESLGATTSTLAGENAARELITFARARNVSKIVVGKTERPRWKEAIFGSFIDNLIRESGDIAGRNIAGLIECTGCDHRHASLQLILTNINCHSVVPHHCDQRVAELRIKMVGVGVDKIDDLFGGRTRWMVEPPHRRVLQEAATGKLW